MDVEDARLVGAGTVGRWMDALRRVSASRVGLTSDAIARDEVDVLCHQRVCKPLNICYYDER
jgi:hypothetical protein